MKIMFMCTGNVRRSPMAEAMFREMVKDSKFDGTIMCQSSGIAPHIGELPSDNAIKVMAEIGIDISEHKARRLSNDEVEIWNAFFVMSHTHGYILSQGGIPNDKIYVVSQDIEDPRDKSLQGYRECRDKIHNELQIFLAKLQAHLEAQIEG